MLTVFQESVQIRGLLPIRTEMTLHRKDEEEEEEENDNDEAEGELIRLVAGFKAEPILARSLPCPAQPHCRLVQNGMGIRARMN